MEIHYTSEKNVQMLVALMKAHGIRYIIASPGATNVSFVATVQHDPYFKVYSSVDERSAAYMACGLAAESGEPVALSCTGATASRNYVPALTEAYYRKLSILAITSTQHIGRVGQMVPQVIDRSNPMNDIAVFHTHVPTIQSEEDEWDCNVKINTALLALTWHGGGPVHINLTTTYSDDYSVKELPSFRVIKRIMPDNDFPIISGKIGVFVGAHNKWTERLIIAVDRFCELYNAVVICDNTSNYHGKYGVFANLITNQSGETEIKQLDYVIHIGEISGAYIKIEPKKVWRVSQDGAVRDLFHKLEYVFEMDEITFFERLISVCGDKTINTSYYRLWKNEYDSLLAQIPQLPFSNIWTAQQTYKKLPTNSILYLGILNSLRSWNFFELPNGITGYSNTGGFGIDGIMSSAVGVSISNPEKLCFTILGDLAFFYDLNVLGNRHIGSNLRILLINNGCGTEFKNYNHSAHVLGNEVDEFVAARGHFGKQSDKLIKDYATDLGYEYLSAHNKEEYLKNLDRFVIPEITEKPMVFEVFTNSSDESDALRMVNTLKNSHPNVAKSFAKKILGKNGIKLIKKIFKRG